MDKSDPLVSSSSKLGEKYERLAEEYFRNKGYEILTRNYRYRHYEIDLILKQQSTIVFVEVKYRGSDRYGKPYQFVTRTQRLNIIKASRKYLQHNKQFSKGYVYRFDIITYCGDSEKPEYFRNAFRIDEFSFLRHAL